VPDSYNLKARVSAALVVALPMTGRDCESCAKNILKRAPERCSGRRCNELLGVARSYRILAGYLS